MKPSEVTAESVRVFRAKVKAKYPDIKISVKTVSFEGFGYGRARCLGIADSCPAGPHAEINLWAVEAGIVPSH